MIAFGHSSFGVVAGSIVIVTFAKTGVEPGLLLTIAFLFGIITHYLGDFIPHGHYKFGAKHISFKSLSLFVLDFFGVILFLLTLAYLQIGLGLELLVLCAAIAGAQLPDIWEAAIDLKLIPNSSFAKAHRHFHYDILHWHNEPKHSRNGRPMRVSDIWQVGVFLISIWIILHLPKL